MVDVQESDERRKFAMEAAEAVKCEAANVKHLRAVNRSIRKELVAIGVSKEVAMELIKKVVNKEIPSLVIIY